MAACTPPWSGEPAGCSHATHGAAWFATHAGPVGAPACFVATRVTARLAALHAHPSTPSPLPHLSCRRQLAGPLSPAMSASLRGAGGSSMSLGLLPGAGGSSANLADLPAKG